MDIAVVGAASPLGLRLVRDLAEHPSVGQVTAIDEHTEPIEEFIESRDLERAEPIEAEVAKEALRKAVAGSSVVVATMTSPEHQLEAAEAAIEAGAHFISTCYSTEIALALSELQEPARAAKVGVVVGLGMAPGISSLLAVMGAELATKARRVRIAWVGSATGSDGRAMFDRYLQATGVPATIYRHPGLAQVKAGSDREDVFFPEPIGWRNVRSADSQEPLTIHQSIPGLEEVQVKAALTERAFEFAARSGLASMLTNPSIFSGALSGSRQAWSAVRVDVWGQEQVTLAILDQTSNLLSAPVVAACLLIESSEIPRGVNPPEAALDAKPFFDLMAERGLRVARLFR